MKKRVDLSKFETPAPTLWAQVKKAVREAEMRGQDKDRRDVERFVAKLTSLLSKAGK